MGDFTIRGPGSWGAVSKGGTGGLAWAPRFGPTDTEASGAAASPAPGVGGSPSMEQVVRPFVVIDSAPRAERPKRPPLPGEDSEAFISWGKASNFLTRAEAPTEPVNLDPNDDTPPGSWLPIDDGITGHELEMDPWDLANRWDEIARTTEDVRVENPEDPEQYVVVQRIQSVVFKSNSSSMIVLNFKDW